MNPEKPALRVPSHGRGKIGPAWTSETCPKGNKGTKSPGRIPRAQQINNGIARAVLRFPALAAFVKAKSPDQLVPLAARAVAEINARINAATGMTRSIAGVDTRRVQHPPAPVNATGTSGQSGRPRRQLVAALAQKPDTEPGA